MKIIWVHTFNPIIKNSGVFMHEFLKIFNSDQNIKVEMFYLGSLGRIGFLLKNIFILYKRRNEYDILHCQYGSFCSLVCMFIPRKKIVSLRGSDLFILKSGTFKEKLHSKLAVFFTYISIRNYDKVIVMSKQMKELLKKKYSSKVEVITDPINLEKFNQEDKIYSRKLLFDKYPSDKKLILFTSISKNNPIKRPEMAAKVVDKLNQISKTNSFELISANNFSNDEMKFVFSAVDLCLLTSLYEGFPNCIKESIACNTPFVSTDVSDLRDLAAMTNNCFVCNDSVEELAEKILVSISIPKNNIRNIINYLSMENTKLELVKVYYNLLNIH